MATKDWNGFKKNGDTYIPNDATARTGLQNKVDKVTGKGLSTNDYDNTAKGIVDNIQANVIANTQLIADTVGWSGKNRLENEAHSSSNFENKGVNFTVNNDKSVTVNGTPTGDIYFTIMAKFNEIGTFKLSGMGANGGQNFRLQAYIYNSSDVFQRSATDAGSSVEFTINDGEYARVQIVIITTQGAISNKTVYPMVTDADILDPTYEPYFGSTAFPRSEQAVLGAKNWLNIPKGTYTQYDVTIVVDDTGITLNGTCNATSGTKVNVSNLPISINAKVADYKGVDVTNNMSDDCYIWMSSPFSGGNINGKSWTVSTATKVTGALSLKGGVTYTNFKIHPMIVLASDIDLSTYVPYAMTNRELTEKVQITTVQNIDLDSITKEGEYRLNGGLTNAPNFNYGYLTVKEFSGSNSIEQIATSKGIADKIYRRIYDNNAWSSWYAFTGTVVS